MIRRALLVSTDSAFRGVETGGGLRSKQIAGMLKSLDFEVTHLPANRISEGVYYDLICVVSFANASVLRQLRKMGKFLWYDATDSWRVTRRSLFALSPGKEVLRLTRDAFYSRAYTVADLVTYCTRRDMHGDNLGIESVFVVPNRIEEFSIDNNFGFRFVFVGPYSYPPNRFAIDFLLNMSGRAFLSKVPFHIYSKDLTRSSYPENVTIHSSISNRELYGINDVHLAPIIHGAGMKYKTLIPISLGLNVISTFEGAVGLSEAPNLHIAKDLTSFLNLMVSIVETHVPISMPPSFLKGTLYEVDESLKVCELIARVV